MKTAIISIIAIVVIGIGAVVAYQTVPALRGNPPIPTEEKTPIGTIAFLTSDITAPITIIREGSELAGEAGAPVFEGDLLKTGNQNRAALILSDSSVVRFDSQSEILIKKEGLFDLQAGQLWSSISQQASGTTFGVETPTITASIRGTEFNTSYKNAVSEIYLAAGGPVLVSLRNDPQLQAISLTPNQMIVIRDASLVEDFKKGPVNALITNLSEWIKFNLEASGLTPVVSSTAPRATSSSIKKPTPKPAATAPVRSSTPTPINQTPTPLKVLKLTLQGQEATEIDKQVNLSVMADYSNGTRADVTTLVSWRQFPGLGLIDNRGVFRAANEGQTKINATFEGVVSNDLFITVSRAKAIIDFRIVCEKNYGKGQLPTAQCTATATYSDDSIVNVTQQTNWSVVGGGSAKGTITGGGTYQPSSPGRDIIQGIFSGKEFSLTIDIP